MGLVQASIDTFESWRSSSLNHHVTLDFVVRKYGVEVVFAGIGEVVSKVLYAKRRWDGSSVR
jgi:hypothetical protein